MERTGSIKEQRVSIDLIEERKKCNFNEQELAEFLYNGKDSLRLYQERQRIISSDPILKGSEKYYEMSKAELHQHQHQKAKRMAELGIVQNYDAQAHLYGYGVPQMCQGISPLGLHLTMFSLGIQNLASEEQLRNWGEKLRQVREILGTYVQTELGHGSNVQGIETTATFDKRADQFIINSPTISSTKYWPGDSGIHTNHCLLYAQLIIDGKRHGVQPFLVQTRDLNTHQLLNGVQGGDIGPKFGYHSKENGWLRFDNLRIPRTNLMMRYVEVDREGNFKKKGDLRNLYSVMMISRVGMIGEMSQVFARALTIAIRYSVVRRQFNSIDGDIKERKLLDYQTQMHKLAPQLAYCMAFGSVAKKLVPLYYELQAQSQKGDFKLLDLCHHLSAGFKSLGTQVVYEGLDRIRAAAGGAGYSQWSGLPYLVQLYAPNTTFEGDNVLMAQQASRLIMKNVVNITRGMEAQGIFSYLNDLPTLLTTKCLAFNSQQLQDVEILEEALKIRAAHSIQKAVAKMASSPHSQNEKVNSLFGLDLVGMTLLHMRYLTFKFFKEDIQRWKFSDPNAKAALTQLLILLGVYELSQSSQPLYECGYFKPGTAKILNQALKEVLVRLRPLMVPLVEAYRKSDSELTSAIGNSFGDIYETQFSWAKGSKLNQKPLGPGVQDYLMPVVHGKL